MERNPMSLERAVDMCSMSLERGVRGVWVWEQGTKALALVYIEYKIERSEKQVMLLVRSLPQGEAMVSSSIAAKRKRKKKRRKKL